MLEALSCPMLGQHFGYVVSNSCGQHLNLPLCVEFGSLGACRGAAQAGDVGQGLSLSTAYSCHHVQGWTWLAAYMCVSCWCPGEYSNVC